MVRPTQTDLRYDRATVPLPSTTHATQNAHNVLCARVPDDRKRIRSIASKVSAGWRNDVSFRNSIVRIERQQLSQCRFAATSHQQFTSRSIRFFGTFCFCRSVFVVSFVFGHVIVGADATHKDRKCTRGLTPTYSSRTWPHTTTLMCKK